jgi:hypothetical protein
MRPPGCDPHRWRLNLDAAPCVFDILNLDDDVKPVGRLAEAQRAPLPLVVEDLQWDAAEVKLQASGAGTIPLLDTWETLVFDILFFTAIIE